MKKIFNMFLLMAIFFLPVVVDAKANFEFKAQYENELFFFKENNQYYFFDALKEFNSDEFIKVYDKNNTLLRTEQYSNAPFSIDVMIESKYFDKYYDMFVGRDSSAYDKDTKTLYYVEYYDETFYVNNGENASQTILFNDDLTFTKKLLGKKYDAYLAVKNLGVEVNSIIEYNGYFVVYYNNEDFDNYISILDKNYNIVLTIENTYLGEAIYVYDNLIYIMETDKTVAVYKLDGTKVETLTINNSYVNDNDTNGDSVCGDYVPYKIHVEGNEFYITYMLNICESRVANYDAETVVEDRELVEELTLKYELNFEVSTVSSTNGEFTYETKVDEDGRSYVELKITPKAGYSVEDIIVTDLNGNRVEVKNNKFYMPTSDVRIEVKYVEGEYLPIPDTFLGKSSTLIVIGLILIGLGVYTFNYINVEEK